MSPFYIYSLKLTKLYNNAVYIFQYWYSLKITINNCSINKQQCFYIQELVQFVGDEIVYT